MVFAKKGAASSVHDTRLMPNEHQTIYNQIRQEQSTPPHLPTLDPLPNCEVFLNASIIFFLSLSAAGSAIDTLIDSSYTGWAEMRWSYSPSGGGGELSLSRCLSGEMEVVFLWASVVEVRALSAPFERRG